MPTRRGGYRNSKGERVPSVTTVLKTIGWGTEGLMAWAAKETREGRDYKQSRRKAADAGTIAHAMCEAYLLGRVYTPPDDISQETLDAAVAAFEQFPDFVDANGLIVFRTEYGFVNEIDNYGGTLDIAGMYRDTMTLIDLKTSKAVYPDYALQLAAYREGWNQQYGDDPKLRIDQALILRFGKADRRLRLHAFDKAQLDDCFAIFRSLLHVHTSKDRLDAMVRGKPLPTIADRPVLPRARRLA